MLNFQNIICFLACIVTGLMSGLFFSYSTSVSPGLKNISDAASLASMQSINRVIQNPIFFMVFFGALILLPLNGYLQYERPVTVRSGLFLAAAIVYITGAFGVTIFGNIPLNNTLDKFDLSNASPENMRSMRNLFETRWNNLNLVRTLASTISFAMLVLALLFSKRV
jgi:uncharacterized membrane protein